jgi:hypothetical protein
MNEASGSPGQATSPLEDVLPTAVQVLTDPRGFFTSMPRGGGYEAPGIFAAIMLVAYGVIIALPALVRLHMGGFLGALLLMPILGAIGLLIGAAILLLVSRALGGEASFESSFRITAYVAVLAPVQAVAMLVPYLPILVQAYEIYIVIVAVIVVHKVAEQKAWTVLGGIGALLLLFSFSATMATRRVAPKIDDFSRHMQKSAEEIGKASENLQKELGKAMEHMGRDMQQGQQQEEEN